MTIRITHIGDIHYSDKFMDEVDRCMEFTINYLRKSKPDAIIIPGDTFDHRLEQNSPALLRALQRVRELGNIAPTLILQGTFSHDAPHAIDVFRHLKADHSIHVADKIQRVVLTDEGHWTPPVDNKVLQRDRLLISCLPSINKGNVAAAVGAENVAQAVGNLVADLLASWAPLNREARALGIPTIVTTHGTVSGSRTEHGVPMMGFDHELTSGTLFAAEASAALLNHIHEHQAWEKDGRVAAYAGSLGRLHFGEMSPKGFLVWDVQADSATYEFIETPAKQLIDIEFTGSPDMAEIARIAAAAPAHAHVRVRWAVDEEHRASVDKSAIAALLAHVADVKLEGRILPVQRQRAAGIGQAPSLHDKLKRWCEITSTPYEPLAARLEQLLGRPTAQPAGREAA